MTKNHGPGPEGAGERVSAAQERLARIVALMKRDSKLTEEEVAFFHDEVFPHIYETHYGLVMDWLRKRMLDDRDIEDLHQEAFCAFFEDVCKKGFSVSIPALLCSHARWQYLNHFHARQRSPMSLGLPSSRSERPPSGPNAERIAVAREIGGALLADLDPENQAVVELVFLSELTHEEAAEALGITVGTLKGRVTKAKEDIASIARRLLDSSPGGRS